MVVSALFLCKTSLCAENMLNFASKRLLVVGMVGRRS